MSTDKEYYINQDNLNKSNLNMNEVSCQNCLICFDKEPDAVIMECGHGGLF